MSHADWSADLETQVRRDYPPLIPIEDAEKITNRGRRTLKRAADAGCLTIIPGRGKSPSLVPRASLLAWIASWPRIGA